MQGSVHEDLPWPRSLGFGLGGLAKEMHDVLFRVVPVPWADFWRFSFVFPDAAVANTVDTKQPA